MFEIGLARHGIGRWKAISLMVGSRNGMQVKYHARQFFKKLYRRRVAATALAAGLQPPRGRVAFRKTLAQLESMGYAVPVLPTESDVTTAGAAALAAGDKAAARRAARAARKEQGDVLQYEQQHDDDNDGDDDDDDEEEYDDDDEDDDEIESLTDA